MNTVNVPSVPYAHAEEMFHLLGKNFKIRSNDFRSHAASISILENSFSLEISDSPEKRETSIVVTTAIK
jgi:hypothetical protein